MTTTIDPDETRKFAAMAEEWWDPQGKFAPLHAMNPVRLDYITRAVAFHHDRDLRAPRPFAGLSVVDIGCGGGLLSEPMARLGATVTGIDAAGETLPVARHHAEAQDLEIEYRETSAEELAAEGARFDVVLNLEVIEHVADPAAFMRASAALMAQRGMMLTSTLNRTARSFALAIVGAEYVLGWLPRGTHTWHRFVTPDELSALAQGAGLEMVDRTGLVFDPLSDRWSMSERDLSVNYIATSLRAR